MPWNLVWRGSPTSTQAETVHRPSTYRSRRYGRVPAKCSQRVGFFLPVNRYRQFQMIVLNLLLPPLELCSIRMGHSGAR